MQTAEPYSGIENLEVMQDALNYNSYLLKIVRKHSPADGKILDFGAGGGQFAIPLAGSGADITAVEPDNFLRQILQEKGVATVAQAQELPNLAFEYIYTLNVLEHIQDDAGTLRELHSKLAATGILLIYVPAFPVLYTSMDRKVGHFRRYTRASLAAAVHAAGFEIENVSYADSLGFFATLLFKLMSRTNGDVNRSALKAYDRWVFPLSRRLDRITRNWFGKNMLLIARKNSRG